jgi:Cu(I)/Ag(I) efflux system membrane fusion protein
MAEGERATAHAAAERARAVLAAFGSATPRAALAGDEAWVMAEVPQDDVARVRPGAAVGFEIAPLGGRALAGRVEAAATYVSTSTRTAPVRLRVRDPEKVLRPGMTGIASIAVGAPRTTVVVPAEAILQDGANCLAVLEEQPGRFLPRPVEPGATVGGWTEVRTGLEPGTRVVTTGATSVLSATRLAAAPK